MHNSLVERLVSLLEYGQLVCSGSELDLPFTEIIIVSKVSKYFKSLDCSCFAIFAMLTNFDS